MKFVFCLAAVLMIACQPTAPLPAAQTQHEAPAELKIYQVPAAYRAEAGGIIRALLRRGKEAPLGSVAVGPTGQLLVTAPASFHPGVAQFVARLHSEKPKPVASVALSYWVLVGVPSQKATPAAQMEPALGPVVEAIQKANGSMSFRLLERLRLSSVSGESAQTKGAVVHVRQTATAYDDRVLAELEIRPGRSSKLETRVQFPAGKTVVLGHAGLHKDLAEELFPEGVEGLATVFYVVRADR